MIPDTSVWAALEDRIRHDNTTPVVSYSGKTWRADDLREAAEDIAARLAARGVGKDARVLVVLPNSIDHVFLILALARLGAIWIAISPDRRGPALQHIVANTEPLLTIADPAAVDALIDCGVEPQTLVVFKDTARNLADCISAAPINIEPQIAKGDDLRAIIFTSGTTGPPKGAFVTERMLVASACGAGLASDATPGDRFLLWEPLYHIGGSQMLVLALLRPIELFMVPRFSASRFWDEVCAHRINKIHYLGGILEILLGRPGDPLDTRHEVSLGFGAGARPEVWRAFQDRFGVALREVYGLTEASSFTTINREGRIGSIGRPVPWVDVDLVDANGAPVSQGHVGEITVRPKLPGLLTRGYLNDADATAGLIRNGTLFTGDLAISDASGRLTFVGRKKEAIRVRGELVSSWQVEAALLAHPDVAECAAVPVPAEIGEEEILVFIRPKELREIDVCMLAQWAEGILSARDCPRYWQLTDDFPRTPSARIDKTALPRDSANAYDARRD